MLKRVVLSLGLATASAMAAVAAETSQAGWFPFVISYGGETNATSMAHLLDAPAGKHGFVRVAGAEFVTDAGPIRFNGTNLTGPANFPAHADADRLAARLARLGINCVRLHFMDTWYQNFMVTRLQGILDDDTTTQRRLSPTQLEKLDYLIAALKKQGVYVNMNLHVGRTLDTRDGLPNGSPWANKTVGQFMPRMVELQREYAHDLLTHVNAYTGNAYTDEPAVAMIEISNEDQGIVLADSGGHLARLPKSFREELARQWNVWLKGAYASRDALRDAWMRGMGTLGDEELLSGKWRMEQGDGKAVFAADSLRVEVSQEGAKYYPKLTRPLRLWKGQTYTVSLEVRRTAGKGIVNCTVIDPGHNWKLCGLQELVTAGASWQKVEGSFEAEEDASSAILQLSQLRNGTYEFRNVTVRAGMPTLKADPTEGFAEGRIPAFFQRPCSSPQMRRDWKKFLVESETAYWTGMQRYVREVLKAKAPVSGTQAGYYSPLAIQEQLDYVDSHAYFHHPSGKNAAWVHPGVTNDWVAGGESMVHRLDCALGLERNAHARAKPFTVSEYSHPYPSPFVGEGQPLISAYGRMMGWNGIFQYSYNHFPQAYEPQGMPWCIFDGIATPTVLAHLPACAGLLVRGDLAVDASRPDFSTKGSVMSNATGEVVWNRERTDREYFLVKTRNTKLFVGYADGREIDLGGIALTVGTTGTGAATISLVSRFGRNGRGPESILVAATADCGNTGAKVERVSKSQVRLLDRGHSPMLAEGVPLTLRFTEGRSDVVCYALGPDGARRQEVAKGSRFDLGPQYQTLWYELVLPQ